MIETYEGGNNHLSNVCSPGRNNLLLTFFMLKSACDEGFLEIMQIIIHYEQRCAAVNVKIF